MANSYDTRNPCLRKDVFDCINKERDYQLKRWGIRQSDGSFKEIEKPLIDYIVYMQDYLTAAIHRASRECGFEGAREELVKVVTLGIACLENNGCPQNLHNENVINNRDNLPA